MFRGLRQRFTKKTGADTTATAAAAPPDTAPHAAAAPVSAAADAPAAVAPDDLARPAMERIAEDEALRGDLTDDGYTPLQTWAFARIKAMAGDAAHAADPQSAMDAATDKIRSFVQDAVAAAKNTNPADLASSVVPPVVPEASVGPIVAALRAVPHTDDADATAIAIAKALDAS